MSTTPEPCPICGVIDCGGLVYPLMVERYLAGRDVEHWRRIHDRRGRPAPARRPVASTRRLLGLAEACPWRTKEPGCCTGYLAWCGVARSGRVAQLDCIECVGQSAAPHPSGSRAGPRE